MMGTVVAQKMHLSAPLAMVTAGLVVGNDTIRNSAMSDITETYVDKFWELIDILLNTLLFVLIGMEMLVLTFEFNYFLAGMMAIFIVLGCRYLSLLLPINFFKKKLDFVPNTNLIMTWGGLRGGYFNCTCIRLDRRDASRFIFGNHLCGCCFLYYCAGINGWEIG